ncbi:hypothetical protein B0H19DRAFT_1083809 [Mycena capillaripes]|nr:hypothetical protein B0H19DRAFT_1083809 [Mycena capillaripes]
MWSKNSQCQTNDWEVHGVACGTAGKNTEVARMLGSEARHLSCWTGANILENNLLSQLYGLLGRVLRRIELCRLRTAKCVSEAELRQEFAARYSSEWKIPRPAPLCARIWLVDDGLSYGLESGDQMAEMIGIEKLCSQVFPGMKCEWLALLADSIVAGSALPPHEYIYRMGRTRTVDALRYTHTEVENISRRAYRRRALNIPQHPNRIDVEEGRQGGIKA